MAVLAELSNQGHRYQELHNAIDGISHKVLTDTLRRAERDGLLTRYLDPGRVETATLYQFTCCPRPLGRGQLDPGGGSPPALGPTQPVAPLLRVPGGTSRWARSR